MVAEGGDRRRCMSVSEDTTPDFRVSLVDCKARVKSHGKRTPSINGSSIELMEAAIELSDGSNMV